jgi:hypothetical protein
VERPSRKVLQLMAFEKHDVHFRDGLRIGSRESASFKSRFAWSESIDRSFQSSVGALNVGADGSKVNACPMLSGLLYPPGRALNLR